MIQKFKEKIVDFFIDQIEKKILARMNARIDKGFAKRNS